MIDQHIFLKQIIYNWSHNPYSLKLCLHPAYYVFFWQDIEQSKSYLNNEMLVQSTITGSNRHTASAQPKADSLQRWLWHIWEVTGRAA